VTEPSTVSAAEGKASGRQAVNQHPMRMAIARKGLREGPGAWPMAER
jgi:hypothetical protein